MKKYLKNWLAASLVVFGMAACVGDLDKLPVDPRETTPDIVYSNNDSYRSVLAKCYAGLALSGQEGPDGDPDITGIDEGFSTYIRQMFKAQVLTTDEGIVAWNDGNLRDYHDQDWNSSNEFITAMYNRIYYQITLVNEFIRESAEDKLIGRGQEDILAEVSEFRAEARFLRAFSYYHALDMYGSVPFVLDTDPVGAFKPDQISRSDLFAWVEAELLDLEDDLKAPGSNEYGRVDKAAAWMLLSRLYLNAEVYTGTERYTDAATYAKRVIDEGGYQLASSYDMLFMSDNDVTDARNEVIFAVTFDGTNGQTWGGMTYLIAAQLGGTMDLAEFGTEQAWGGNRATKALPEMFGLSENNAVTGDGRSMFHTDGQSWEIDDIFQFQQGWAVKKWKNITSTGLAGSNGTWMDTDYPMFRLAEAYLNYAEAAARGFADRSIALGYINELRERAYGDDSGNISPGELNTDFMLWERGREMYWEMTRRTDLVRYGQFSNGTYLWPWKGGVKGGVAVDAKFDLFPLPADDVNANDKLVQNPGY